MKQPKKNKAEPKKKDYRLQELKDLQDGERNKK